MSILAQNNILKFRIYKINQDKLTQKQITNTAIFELNKIPAIQLIVSTSTSATIQLMDWNDNEVNDPISMTVVNMTDYKRLIYLGTTLTGDNEIEEDGCYYFKIINGIHTYYSDIFRFISDVSEYLKIEATGSDFMMGYNNQYIFDMTNFTYLFYLEVFNKNISFDTEEEANENYGVIIPYFGSSALAIYWIVGGTEHITAFLERLRIFDINGNVEVTWENETYSADDIVVEIEETFDGINSIDIKFEITPENETLISLGSIE
jgi:hypothetical protein